MLVTFQFVCNQVSNNYNWWFVCLYLLHVLWMLLDPACFSLSIFGVVDHVFIYKWRMLLQIIPFCFCWFTCSTASTSWNFQIGCCCLMVENFDNICVQLKRIIFVLLKVLIVFFARKNSTAGNFIVRYNGRQKKKSVRWWKSLQYHSAIYMLQCSVYSYNLSFIYSNCISKSFSLYLYHCITW